MSGSDRFEQEKMDLTPEYMLFQAVLGTYIVDAKSLCRGPWTKRKDQKAAALLSMAENKWTEHICDLIGMPHDRLVSSIKQYIDLGKSGQKKARE